MRFVTVILIVLLALVGCRQMDAVNSEDVSISAELDTEMPTVGDATLIVTITDADGNTIDDATVVVRGDMTHAGMVPVIAEPVEGATDGVYTIPFEFTMGGDWIITIDATLANDEVASYTFEVNSVAGEMDMSDDSMDMDMSSAVSGAYMVIENARTDDVTLVSISADGVGMIQLHETVIDENDMASMQEVDGGILIPAGETVSLIPGGLHAMLMNLENDLVEGESITLTLTFDDGTTIDIDTPITNIIPEMNDDEVIVDNIIVSAFWARATALPEMDMDMGMDSDEEMDMESTEEAE